MRLHASVLAALVAAAPHLARAQDDAADVSAFRDKFTVLHDGKKHYVLLIPFADGDARTLVFYGDGKDFWQQRIFGYSASGTEQYDYTFWEPRVEAPYMASIELREQRHQLTCDKRKTALTPLSEAEARSLTKSARFHKPRWTRRAHALARDNAGKYYFVDRSREPENSKDFRLFIGPKGNLKLQKMLNVVSDSEGEIFATKSGELRLVIGGSKPPVWIAKDKETPLINVPLDQNRVLIYTDLGPYAGERIGTPCDDL